MFNASEIMQPNVVTAERETTIEEVVALLEKHAVSGLPVVDAERRVVGVITEYDLLRGVSAHEMRGTVADFMNSAPITVTENADLAELCELLLKHHIRRVPVTRDGKLVGVIARRDLVCIANVRQQILDKLPVVHYPRPLAAAGV